MAEAPLWRCAKCGTPDVALDSFTALDPRYQTGSCAACHTKHSPVVLETRAQSDARIAERTDKKLREAQRLSIAVGDTPGHGWSEGCCKAPKTHHLAADRVKLLRGL